MDVNLTAQAVATQPPVLQAGGRPTADAAAIAGDTTPNVPLPIPAGTSQSGVVTEAKITGQKPEVLPTGPVERIMKPYGIAMLPETFEENDLTAEEEDAVAEEAVNDRDTGETAPAEDTYRAATSAPAPAPEIESAEAPVSPSRQEDEPELEPA